MCTSFSLVRRFADYGRLLRLDKPIGILLLMWPMLWGLWLAADGAPSGHVFWVFVLGCVLMRSAGCAVNDFADRKIDLHVERTQNRPLTTGRISSAEALGLAALLALMALGLAFTLGLEVVLMSIPAVFLAASYPFTKRFFSMPQAVLGVAFSFSIPMAFVAVQGAVPLHAWLLFLANLFWTIAYDTEYALVDKNDDLKLNIKTAAITLGKWDIFAIMGCYGLCLVLWVAVALLATLHPIFYVFVAGAAGLAMYHYTLIRERNRQKCFKAFLHNNWFGGLLFVGLVIQSHWPS